MPLRLEEIINKALEKDRGLRYQNAFDLRADLKRLERDSDSRPVATPLSAVARPHRRWGLALGGALLLALLGALGWRLVSHQGPGATAEPVKVMPFTTDGGLKLSPRLSPDAERVAYSWTGPADDNWDVYVKAVGLGTKPLRLTEHPAHDWSPTWSPDGRQIAFVRESEGSGAIYMVPSAGGQERKLIDVSGAVWAPHLVPALSWSPDGRWLFLGEKSGNSTPARIVRLSTDTLEKTPLTSPKEGTLGDFFPALSPDARHLAFVRSDSRTWGNMDVWVQPASGGEPRRLTFGKYDFCGSLAWTREGDALVFATGFDALEVLRVRLDGGTPEPVSGAGGSASDPSVRGKRMVYLQVAAPPVDTWRVAGRATPRGDRKPQRLIFSSRADQAPAYSPDGRRIAFDSGRSGNSNVWVCDSEGKNSVQLTTFGAETGFPAGLPTAGRSSSPRSKAETGTCTSSMPMADARDS